MSLIMCRVDRDAVSNETDRRLNNSFGIAININSFQNNDLFLITLSLFVIFTSPVVLFICAFPIICSSNNA